MKTILVVDDERQIRQMLENHLNGHGYGVETAASGVQAIGQMAAGDFDLMITDIEMPGGVSGNDLTQTLCLANLNPDLGCARKIPALYM